MTVRVVAAAGAVLDQRSVNRIAVNHFVLNVAQLDQRLDFLGRRRRHQRLAAIALGLVATVAKELAEVRQRHGVADVTTAARASQ